MEKEVRLSPEQAEKAVACILGYLREHDLDPTWNEFLSGKAQKAKKTVDKTGEKMTEQINDFANSANKALDDFADKTQKKIKDLKHKAGRYLLDDEDKK